MSKLFVRSLYFCALTCGAFTLMADDDRNDRARKEEDDGPTISSHSMNRLAGAPTKGGITALSPILRHSGPVMTTPKVYLIWYGNWNQANNSDTPAGQAIVRDFLYGLNNSAYFQINTTYGGPTGSVLTGGEITVAAPLNSALSDSGVQSVVSNAINSGRLPKDANGIYVVLTSSDIAKSGFCTSYCGWHTRATIAGVDTKFSFVGNANRCLNSCAGQTIGPNGNAGVDGMLSVLAHELEETATDPDLNAWFDRSGAENADKCAWTFGQNPSVLATGAYYNMTLPGLSTPSRNYLIQRNLAATDNKCYVNYNTRVQ